MALKFLGAEQELAPFFIVLKIKAVTPTNPR
jgi:hypothetical protein